MRTIKLNRSFIIPHIFLTLLIAIIIFVPNQRLNVKPWESMIVGIIIIEIIFLYITFSNEKDAKKNKGSFDIVTFIWLTLIVWEILASVLNKTHPVLIPAPENVFYVFRKDWTTLITNVIYSMQLLIVGFFPGLILAVFLGLFAGWIPRIRNFIYPIANVIAPIPAIVFSPYLVAIMPSFRSASAMVIFLGVFWPRFLTTVNRVTSLDEEIYNSARMLEVDNFTMIRKILLPYIYPEVVSGLKVSLTTSLLMLNFAELMGATHGMGYFVQNSIAYANYTQAIAGIIVIGFFVTVLNKLVSNFQHKAIKWK